MLKIEQVKDGLLLSIPKQSDREELYDEYIQDKLEKDIWYELFEPYSCNGSYTPVDPEQVYVGLTSDPYIIAESATPENNGDITVYGKIYHCPNYMVISIIDKLINDGEYTLSVINDTGKEGERLSSHDNSIIK